MEGIYLKQNTLLPYLYLFWKNKIYYHLHFTVVILKLIFCKKKSWFNASKSDIPKAFVKCSIAQNRLRLQYYAAYIRVHRKFNNSFVQLFSTVVIRSL